MSSSQHSYYKPGNISQIEAGHMSKQPKSRLQAFRRSLSKPFGDKGRRPESYYELDNKGDSKLQGSLLDGKVSSHLNRDIEVEVSVEQTSDANSADFSKPSEWRPC